MPVVPEKLQERRAGSSLVRSELTLLAVGLGLLAFSAYEASGGKVPHLDQIVFDAVNGLPSTIYWPVWLVMQFGNGLAIAVVAVVALGWRRFRLAIGLGIAGLSVYLLATVVKALVHRPRPGALLADVHLRNAPATGAGYPSGHAAVAFALAVIAWLWFSPRLRWLFLAPAICVCFARVYVGAHFPLDVAGGAAMGIISGALVGLLLKVRRHGNAHRKGRTAAVP